MPAAPDPTIVIGAGAAGLMAAIFAAEGGGPVLLLERTGDGGRKILISGGGRCNILPSELDPGRFVSDSPAHLVRRLLAAWPLSAQRAFFEGPAGIPLQVESATGKLFPVSNRAREVRDRLVVLARRRGVELRCDCMVHDLRPAGGVWEVQLHGGDRLAARAVILATGGLSVPATGSDGTGLELARRLGHRVNRTYPALTPLTADPPVHGHLSGVSLPVTIEARLGRKRLQSSGGFLFTHRGYSGPSVLDLSHLAVRSRLEGRAPHPLLVRWGTGGEAEWEQRLTARGTRTVAAVLREELPGRLVDQLLLEAGGDPGRQLAQLPRAERRALIGLLTRYALPWTGDEGYRKAEVTGGGVALTELDPATLQSRRHPGLFFCGEILDAFGPIGGFNFAWAWATGKTAGQAAGKA
jgi:predicted Rossmann fold flavoprotein